MLENIDKIIEFVTMLTTVLFVVCRSNANVKKKIDEHLKPNGGSSVRDALDRIEVKLDSVDATQRALLELQEADSGYFLGDKSGSVFWVSDRFAEIMDLRRDKCLGQEWISAITKTLQSDFYAKWNFSIQTGRPLDIPTTTVKGKNIVFKVVSIKNKDNQITGFVGLIKAASS